MVLIEFFKIADAKARMTELPTKIRKKVLRKVARAGAGVLKKVLKEQLRTLRRTKSTEKSLGIRVKMYKDGDIRGFIGVRRDKKFTDAKGKRVIPGFYWHFINLGHAASMRKVLRKNPRVPFRNGKPRYIPGAGAKNVLGKAIDASRSAVAAKMEATFVEAINTEFSKQTVVAI